MNKAILVWLIVLFLIGFIFLMGRSYERLQRNRPKPKNLRTWKDFGRQPIQHLLSVQDLEIRITVFSFFILWVVFCVLCHLADPNIRSQTISVFVLCATFLMFFFLPFAALGFIPVCLIERNKIIVERWSIRLFRILLGLINVFLLFLFIASWDEGIRSRYSGMPAVLTIFLIFRNCILDATY